MIKQDPKKSFEIMGADVKQTGEQFEKSQSYLRWQDRAANQKFFAGEHQAFRRRRRACCSNSASSRARRTSRRSSIPSSSSEAEERARDLSGRGGAAS